MTKNTSKIFFLFLIIHLFVWTLIPSLTNVNLPLDTIEALAWGSNLDWGFNKHPPMSAFAIEFFYQIFGSQDWAYYFLSQIFVISTFFIVWIFSKDFFKKKFLVTKNVSYHPIFRANFRDEKTRAKPRTYMYIAH